MLITKPENIIKNWDQITYEEDHLKKQYEEAIDNIVTQAITKIKEMTKKYPKKQNIHIAEYENTFQYAYNINEEGASCTVEMQNDLLTLNYFVSSNLFKILGDKLIHKVQIEYIIYEEDDFLERDITLNYTYQKLSDIKKGKEGIIGTTSIKIDLDNKRIMELKTRENIETSPIMNYKGLTNEFELLFLKEALNIIENINITNHSMFIPVRRTRIHEYS